MGNSCQPHLISRRSGLNSASSSQSFPRSGVNRPSCAFGGRAEFTGEVISAWTGIPVGKMHKMKINTVLSLQSLLGTRVIGQTHALDAISQRISTSRAGLDDRVSCRVFMFVGPSGVGKTETASPWQTCCMAANHLSNIVRSCDGSQPL